MRDRFKQIKDVVARELRVPRRCFETFEKKGLRPWARHVAIWVASQFSDTSKYLTIKKGLNRTQGTIVFALRKVANERSLDPKIRQQTDRILALCKPDNRLREVGFIKAVVSSQLDVPLNCFDSRIKEHSRARHIAIWVGSKATSLSQADLARAFGTVPSAVSLVLSEMNAAHANYPFEAETMDKLLRIVTAAFVAEGLCCHACGQPISRKQPNSNNGVPAQNGNHH